MALFQSSVLKDHLRLQEEQQVEKAYKKFTAFFHNPEIQENIRGSKEEQFQATFLSELFVKVLGYTMNPQPGYELTTEFKNQKNARKADGAILKDGLAIGVIELKGTNTKHLEGIRQQAFDYKANQKGCVYVITSNFEKLRFYINDATEFVEFDLFELNRKDFSLLYLCLHKDNIFSHRPLKIKEASLVEEEVITRQFYKDYSVFKRELFRDLVLRNVDRIKTERPPGYESEAKNPEAETKKQIRLNLFKKSQKLIDRFLFIFFAEDRGLLPPNSIHRIIADWNKLKDLDAETPLYKRFQLYFSYLDTGRKGSDKKAEIFAYNGGLFKPDPILDMIEIDDDLLYKHTARLATYDFESQVDVNILGHIFENSLNEIESVNAEIEGADFDKQKSKRKKDGVFYTPKYITKYIVENTVGRLCEEKKSELGFREEEYYKGRKRRQKETLESLIKILDDYREWLLKLTICDPACGSGAFLNQALDFLIKEHRYIDELKHKLLGGGLVFSDIETTILENNIYGVDINEESVEIAKLSLWLRTAQPRRKLNDLSSNIKCGNSLIDDKKVAGNKAFKWEEEFPDVFNPSSGSGGGFDVVIGNPPYGASLNLSEKDYLFKKFSFGGLNNVLSDTYISFYIISISILLKRDGCIGFITPNSWRLVLSGSNFRDFLCNPQFSLLEIVQHFEKVFPEATVDCDTVILKKKQNRDNHIEISIRIQTEDKLNHFISQSLLKEQEFFNLHLTSEMYDLKKKIEKNSVSVNEILNIKNGVKPYEKGKGKPSQTSEIMRTKPYTSEFQVDQTFSPLIGGSSFHRYKVLWNEDYWIKYGPWLAAPRDEEIFKAPEKLIFRQTGDSLVGTIVDDKYVMRDNTHILLPKIKSYNLKFILAVLNSKLSNFVYWTNNPERGEALAQIKLFHLGLLRIPDANQIEQEKLVVKVNKILLRNEQLLHIIKKFKGFFVSNNTWKISSKLQSWHELEFGDFIKELNKAIKADNKNRAKEGLSPVPELTKKDEFEWMELFEENKKKAVELQREIEKTDKEIDLMVYELYGLTEEEIGIVESS